MTLLHSASVLSPKQLLIQKASGSPCLGDIPAELFDDHLHVGKRFMVLLAACCRVLFKQRDNRFYPPSAWSLALLIVRIPFQLMEALLYSCIVYFWVGECLQIRMHGCMSQSTFRLCRRTAAHYLLSHTACSVG